MKLVKTLLLAMAAFSADAKTTHQVRGKNVEFKIEIPRGTKYEDIDTNVRKMLRSSSVNYMDCMHCSCDDSSNDGPTCTCDDTHCSKAVSGGSSKGTITPAPTKTPTNPPTAHPTVHPVQGKGKGQGGKGKGKGKGYKKGTKRYGSSDGFYTKKSSKRNGGKGYHYGRYYSSTSHDSYDDDHQGKSGKGGKGSWYYDDDYYSGKAGKGKAGKGYYDDDLYDDDDYSGKAGKGKAGKGYYDDDSYDDDYSGDTTPSWDDYYDDDDEYSGSTTPSWDDYDDGDFADLGPNADYNNDQISSHDDISSPHSGKASGHHVSSDGNCPANCETVTYDCMSDGCNVWCYCPDPEWENVPDAIIAGKGS